MTDTCLLAPGRIRAEAYGNARDRRHERTVTAHDQIHVAREPRGRVSPTSPPPSGSSKTTTGRARWCWRCTCAAGAPTRCCLQAQARGAVDTIINPSVHHDKKSQHSSQKTSNTNTTAQRESVSARRFQITRVHDAFPLHTVAKLKR